LPLDAALNAKSPSHSRDCPKKIIRQASSPDLLGKVAEHKLV